MSIRGSIYSCTFVYIRGSEFSFRVFRVFRGSIHSRPFVYIRGSEFPFRVFRVFRGSIHSCPFVSIVYIRGSIYSCTFVSIRGSEFSFRVHSCPFVVQTIRAHSWLLVQFQKKTSRLRCFFEIICRLNHRGVVILGFSLHELPGTM